MTNEEARFVLGAYRSNGGDAVDPAFAAALAQAKNDPALGRWLERAQFHDAAVAKKLAAIAPPSGLREAILAGAQATKDAAPRRAAWWSPGRMVLAAGLAALLAVAGWIWRGSGATTQRLVRVAVDHATHGKHGGEGAAMNALQATLASPATRLGAGLPLDFATLKSTGCRVLRVAGRDVLEVCFVRNGAEFHLYIARRADFPAAGTERMELAEHNGAASVAWADAAHRFVLVSGGGLMALKALL